MNDQQLADLFAEGTAPESDSAFALGVAAGIGRVRRGARLRTLVLPATVVLMLSGAVFVAAGAIEPAFAQLVDGAPQFMGVPMPELAAVVAMGLALGVWRYVLSRSRAPSPAVLQIV